VEMMEIINQEQLDYSEKVNTGTSWTRNEFLDEHGYLVVKNLYDPQKLYHPVPEERGQINYFGSVNRFHHEPEEQQVNGSIARYSHPQYKEAHSQIRLRIEKQIGRKLYNTYYYDRFYFPGQELTKHTDRDACEISVTVHVSTNLKECWPIWIKTVHGEERAVCLEPGDGMIYKGCERPHWREPMPGKKKSWWNKKELYYHQIFFHYVLQDGIRSHCAFDAAR
jgi:hypothetical protein